MKTPTRIGVLAAALALAASVISPAQAARQSTTDAAHDVAKVVCDGSDCSSFTQTVDASRTEGDIRGIVTNHGTSTVVVRVSFAELIQYAQYRWLGVAIKTNEGLNREVRIRYQSDSPSQGRAYLWKDRNASQPLSCAGLSSKTDYSYNTITVTVPRSCLSHPYWVKTGAEYDRCPAGNACYADDARLTGRITQSVAWTGDPVAKG